MKDNIINSTIIGKTLDETYKLSSPYTIRVVIKDDVILAKYDTKYISYRCNVEVKNNIIVKILWFG